MNIILNTSNFPKFKGDSTTPFVYHLAKSLSKYYKITVLAPASENSKLNEVWIKVVIIRYNYFWIKKCQTLFNVGGAINNLRNNPLNVFLLPFFLLHQTIALYLLSKSGKISVINSHWIIPQGISGLIVSKLLNIPHVITIHGGDIFTFNNAFGKIIKKIIAENAKLIVCNSALSKNKLLEITGTSSEKVHIIPAPVEINLFLKQRDNINKIPGSFIYIGRLVEEKGILSLLKAFLILVKQLPNSTLIIVGDGPMRKEYEKFVLDEGIPNVKFTGWLENRCIPSYLSTAWSYVGVSKTSREGWQEAMGISYIEALASGCNVVCNKKAGFLSMINNRSPIFTVKNPENISEISTKMKLSLENKVSRIENLSEFSSESVASKYSNIYKIAYSN